MCEIGLWPIVCKIRYIGHLFAIPESAWVRAIESGSERSKDQRRARRDRSARDTDVEPPQSPAGCRSGGLSRRRRAGLGTVQACDVDRHRDDRRARSARADGGDRRHHLDHHPAHVRDAVRLRRELADRAAARRRHAEDLRRRADLHDPAAHERQVPRRRHDDRGRRRRLADALGSDVAARQARRRRDRQRHRQGRRHGGDQAEPAVRTADAAARLRQRGRRHHPGQGGGDPRSAEEPDRHRPLPAGRAQAGPVHPAEALPRLPGRARQAEPLCRRARREDRRAALRPGAERQHPRRRRHRRPVPVRRTRCRPRCCRASSRPTTSTR